MVDRFKSGFVPPGDIPFEDLGNEDNKSINSNNSSGSKVPVLLLLQHLIDFVKKNFIGDLILRKVLV